MMGWLTHHEIEFINRLNIVKLAGYMGAIPKREKWGGINKDEVIAHCRKRLAQLMALR